MSSLPIVPIKAVLYARVSSEEQEREGYSIQAQRDLMRSYAKTRGISVVEEFTDVESAGSQGRSKFGEMTAYLKKHKTCRTVLVEKTDRLYRNPADLVTIEDLGVDVHLVRNHQIIGPDTDPALKMAHFIDLAMARHFLQNLSLEVKKGMNMKARLGMWPSHAPLGYLNQTKKEGRHVIVPDPLTREAVEKAFEWYASERYSLDELVIKMREAGYRTRKDRVFTRSELQRMLRRRLYSGDFDWNGTMYPGTYEPLVPKDLWSHVQQLLDRRRGVVRGSKKAQFAYSGLIRCGHCGCLLVGELKKNRYVYYRCTLYKQACPEKYVRQEVLDGQFLAVLRGLSFDDDVMALITDTLRSAHESQRVFHERAVARLQVEYTKLDNRVDAMYEDKLDGAIDADMFERKSRAIREKQTETLQQVHAHQDATQKYLVDGARLLELARTAHTVFEKQPPEEKKKLLGFLLSNSTWKEGRLRATLRQPFDMLEVTVSSARTEAPLEGGAEAASKKWLGDRESNPD